MRVIAGQDIRHPPTRASLIKPRQHSASIVARPSSPQLHSYIQGLHHPRFIQRPSNFSSHPTTKRAAWHLTTTHGRTRLVPPATISIKAKATKTPTPTRPIRTKHSPATPTPRTPIKANTNLPTTHHLINNPSPLTLLTITNNNNNPTTNHRQMTPDGVKAHLTNPLSPNPNLTKLPISSPKPSTHLQRAYHLLSRHAGPPQISRSLLAKIGRTRSK
jgi:hypothetical protein